MGAHENGGRGCAGCHAPHSGGRGSGGNIIAGTGASLHSRRRGRRRHGLWGTDTNPIETGNGGAITFEGSYPVCLAGLTWSSGSLYTGVATCLSCHDGNVSKGAMMSGQAYEQAFGLLNFATNAGSNGTGCADWSVRPEPDPDTARQRRWRGRRLCQRSPGGPDANLGKVAAAALGNGLVVTFRPRTTRPTLIAPGSTYAQFVSNYGIPAIARWRTLATAYRATCMWFAPPATTSTSRTSTRAADTAQCRSLVYPSTASFAKIFYVNGPYNPGAPYDPTHVPSTMRFCQECHFSMSSEYYGATTIGTAF